MEEDNGDNNNSSNNEWRRASDTLSNSRPNNNRGNDRNGSAIDLKTDWYNNPKIFVIKLCKAKFSNYTKLVFTMSSV